MSSQRALRADAVVEEPAVASHRSDARAWPRHQRGVRDRRSRRVRGAHAARHARDRGGLRRRMWRRCDATSSTCSPRRRSTPSRRSARRSSPTSAAGQRLHDRDLVASVDRRVEVAHRLVVHEHLHVLAQRGPVRRPCGTGCRGNAGRGRRAARRPWCPSASTTRCWSVYERSGVGDAHLHARDRIGVLDRVDLGQVLARSASTTRPRRRSPRPRRSSCRSTRRRDRRCRRSSPGA